VVTKKKLLEWKNTTQKKIDGYTEENNLLNKENESLRHQLSESRHRESRLNTTINDAHIHNSISQTNNYSNILDTNRTFKINESVEDNLNHFVSINQQNNTSTHTDLIAIDKDKG